MGALVVSALDAALLAWALGGLAALFAHSRAIALLVVWCAGGLVLSIARPVRAHDATAVERESPLLLIGLLIVPLATAPLSAWAERSGLWPLPGGDALSWAGVALSGLGLAIRVAAISRLGSRFSPLVAVQREHALETSGLYAFVRHPGYLGSWLTLAGTVIAFGSAATIPLALVMTVLLELRIAREEALLARHFGDEYRAYRRRTGRLFPGIGRE